MIWNFVIGGLAGWALANFMNSDNDEAQKGKLTLEQALEMLVNDIRNDAQWAMAKCTTEEEREFVYAQVKESVQNLKATLQKKGDEIIADLQSQSAKVQYDEDADTVESRVKEFRQKMDNLADSLNQTLSDLKLASSTV
ncbi:hypothetical protein [Selenomonas ruminis]|uniref:Uncharacterized protein n=1 Tax=Selenomonas ruminis TaxID=2593411 RepID=A0A5D6W4S3_9FIRM|nr:hypothetical protein [Selenomonas sp. mPRGC5]TYZ22917.1 hypothetical protein FZ040_06780 [Selenomonas sp. mPRGC5]